MKYARPPFPVLLWQKFCRIAGLLGYLKRGEKWRLLELLLDYGELHPDFFRKR